MASRGDTYGRQGRYRAEPENVTRDEVRSIAAMEARRLFQGGQFRDAYEPRGIPREAVDGLAIVTSLPARAAQGDEVYYLADAEQGVLWHFVHVPGGGYPWLFIGGSSLYDEVAAVETTTSASYVALATAGPSISLPLPGDYDIDIGCRSHVNTVSGFAGMSYDIGSSGASDTDWCVMNEPTGGHTSPRNIMRAQRKAGIGAVTLTAKYRVGSAGQVASFQHRWMSAIPVRVGRS